LYHPPFSQARFLLDEAKRSRAEMSAEKSVSFSDGIRAAHTTSRNLACEVIVDKGRVEIDSRHIRRDESRGRNGRIPDRRTKGNVVNQIRVSVEQVTIT
jgi:hypothetical protein